MICSTEEGFHKGDLAPSSLILPAQKTPEPNTEKLQ